MKNRNKQLTAVLFVVALALAPIIPGSLAADDTAARATPTPRAQPTVPPRPESSPVNLLADERVSANSEAIAEGENSPVITIHSTDNVTRGKTGSFVLNMNPLMLGGLYVNFSLSGSAMAGVDYVQPLSPAHIGQSGYGVILIHTLADPRGPANRRAYSVVAKLDAGLGYALGIPSSATMWIKP
jgi:hypothetical protein